MKQYGDITKLNGAELDPVDLIVGGSPCQDLSVAGKRAGLDGERSGLFMEMIRIIREMKNATNAIRYCFWENVPGAYSSNGGADFSAVLGEFARLIEPNAPDVPVPEEGWPKSGVLLVSNGSIAWRTHDAQFWGVPQRRRRISVVVDLRGQTAPEILFERKGVSGDPEPGGAQREGTPGSAAEGSGSTGCTIEGYQVTPTLVSRMSAATGNTQDGLNDIQAISFQERAGKPGGEKGILIQPEHTGALSTLNNQSVLCLNDQGGAVMNVSEEQTGTLRSQMNSIAMSQQANALDTMHDQQAIMVYEALGVYSESQTGSTLKERNDGCSNCDLAIASKRVRRLTPKECERLQGFPDDWTNIPGASDSARYRALGNSIALPFWEHLAHRFAEIGGVKTIGSLFDGIGGFPLVFKRAGAETLWTSEIEPFCQKVVEYHHEKGEI